MGPWSFRKDICPSGRPFCISCFFEDIGWQSGILTHYILRYMVYLDVSVSRFRWVPIILPTGAADHWVNYGYIKTISDVMQDSLLQIAIIMKWPFAVHRNIVEVTKSIKILEKCQLFWSGRQFNDPCSKMSKKRFKMAITHQPLRFMPTFLSLNMEEVVY